MKSDVLILHLPAAMLVLVLGLCGTASAITGDLDGDNYVDWNDLDAFTGWWLSTGCSAADWCGGADIDHSSKVDFNDFGLLALHWLDSEFVDHNLVGWYMLDETGGVTAYDSSEYGYNGTLSGGASWEPTGGRYDGAVRFHGDDERVAIPTTGISRLRGTITLWGRLEGAQTQHYRFFFGDRTGGSDDNRIQLYMKDNTVLCTGLADNHNLNTSIMTLSVDTWYHIALTWGGGGGNGYVVYVDGDDKATGTHSAIGVLTASADIGNSGEPSPVGGFNGLIDEVGIWDRVLDASEIMDVKTNGIPRQASVIAWSPSPADGATGVAIDANLNWLPGDYAKSHDVYFGTDPTPDSGEFQDNQPGTTFDPGIMDVDTTYYWQIDEVNDTNSIVWEGDVWSFTTAGPPGPASNPSPADGATGVSTNLTLSWTAGSGATSHDVYFGTDSTPDSGEFQDNQPGTTFDPDIMDINTTYYWRIDEVGPGGTTVGDTWSFTTASEGPTPAFPTAEGAGMWAIGGRGGTVYKVTTLADYAPGEEPIAGSLRAAVEASGPRIVVFDVSGTITLKSLLEISEPYITIAGQTAPGDGICLRDYELRSAADQVIIRYLRCRVGDEIIPLDDPNCPDSLSVTNGHNIIIDHCSASWSVDETLSVSLSYLYPYSPTLGDVTIQWCMITESLHDSVHVKGAHGCGSLIKSGWDNNYTFHHNLYAHHDKRLPSVGNYNDYQDDPNGWTIDFRNNVVYNWDDDYAGYYDADDNGVVKKNFIANYYIRGPQSDNDYAFRERCPHSRNYFSGNWMDDVLPADPWSLVIWYNLDAGEIETIKQSEPFDVEPVATDSADVAYTRVLAGAGAILPARDSVDSRVINEVINGTGGIIDDEDEVGGWPVLESTTPPVDTDNDGMPDDWESARGLDPYTDDSAADRDGDGYTNIEEYINGIPF